MAKDYGKLSADQLKEFVGFLPTLFVTLRDASARIATVSSAKFDEVMAGDYGQYCLAYEAAFTEHLALVVVALNRQDDLKAYLAAPDPQQAVLDGLKHEGEDRPESEFFETHTVLALCYSLTRTIQSMATYGRSISGLLEDVRERGDQDALFKAIRIDRAVLGCPTAMRLIAKAQLRDNKSFFKRLRSALDGPSRKQWASLDQLRYTLLLLRELGVNDLSAAELEALLVDELGVYKRGKGDARKNLWAQYTRSRKLKTI